MYGKLKFTVHCKNVIYFTGGHTVIGKTLWNTVRHLFAYTVQHFLTMTLHYTSIRAPILTMIHKVKTITLTLPKQTKYHFFLEGPPGFFHPFSSRILAAAAFFSWLARFSACTASTAGSQNSDVLNSSKVIVTGVP